MAIARRISFWSHLALAGSALTVLVPALPAPTAKSSVYTVLSGARCKVVRADNESGSTSTSCPGIGGYRVLVEDDDDRQSLTLIGPDRTRHPLNLWKVVTPAFSQLAGTAEWRVTRGRRQPVPVALILRMSASDDQSPVRKETFYVVIVKVTPDRVCVTRKLEGRSIAADAAQRLADSAHDEPCLE